MIYIDTDVLLDVALRRSCLQLLKEVPLAFDHQKKAMTSSFKDKEDAFNYFAALSVGCQAIITRNKSDFKPGKIPVFTPGEYLETFPKS